MGCSMLLEVDHIKVYHDVTCALHIRNVLDAWGYPNTTLDGSFEAHGRDKNTGKDNRPKTKKIRILKGAKLVLVDERSKGVLIS